MCIGGQNNSSNVAGFFLGEHALLNLTLFGFPEPALDLRNTVVVVQLFELAFVQIQDFPALELHDLLGEFTLLTGCFVGLGILLEVELNTDFFVVKHEVQIEQVVNSDERRRIHIAMASQESAEVHIPLLFMVLVVKFHNVKVPLSMPKLVLKIAQKGTEVFSLLIPLREVVLHVQEASLEGLVVDEGQHILLVNGALCHGVPHVFIRNFSEHHVVNQIVQRWVVQSVDVATHFLLQSLVEFRVASISNGIGVHDVRQVSWRQ